jgi:serine/threonine protein kinase
MKMAEGGYHISDMLIRDNKDLERGRMIGSGQSGQVMQMYNTRNNQPLAVKVVLNSTHDMAMLDDLMIKANECPHMIHLYGHFCYMGDLWICMEEMDSNMSSVCDVVYNRLDQHIPEKILGKMTVDVIKGLRFIHKELNIFHQNIKPSNILISRRSEFKVCDFKLSTLQSTPKYLAPEIITGEQPASVQSDVWSCGITLVELAQGTHPYDKFTIVFEMLYNIVQNEPPALSPEGFSKELRDFTAVCLMKDIDKRFNYDQLQELKFYEIGNTEVDVNSWYSEIKTHNYM